jgi:RNA polymerase-interacting CarD/CdnL/TRCF family regulator
MKDQTQIYSVNDWIVHQYYGVGQIIEIDEKPLSGKNVEYYRVKTENSTFWIPVDQADNPRIRPLASQKKIREAFKVLREPPKGLDSKHKKWKRRIKKVKSEGSLEDIAQLVRDLTARSNHKKLNFVEEQALKKFKDRLVKEYSLSMGIDVASARSQLYDILKDIQDS